MNLNGNLPLRSAGEIEKDFLDLLNGRVFSTVFHERLEQLWDETNAIATAMMLSEASHPYIALLTRIQGAFDAMAFKSG